MAKKIETTVSDERAEEKRRQLMVEIDKAVSDVTTATSRKQEADERAASEAAKLAALQARVADLRREYTESFPEPKGKP